MRRKSELEKRNGGTGQKTNCQSGRRRRNKKELEVKQEEKKSQNLTEEIRRVLGRKNFVEMLSKFKLNNKYNLVSERRQSSKYTKMHYSLLFNFYIDISEFNLHFLETKIDCRTCWSRISTADPLKIRMYRAGLNPSHSSFSSRSVVS